MVGFFFGMSHPSMSAVLSRRGMHVFRNKEEQNERNNNRISMKIPRLVGFVTVTKQKKKARDIQENPVTVDATTRLRSSLDSIGFMTHRIASSRKFPSIHLSSRDE